MVAFFKGCRRYFKSGFIAILNIQMELKILLLASRFYVDDGVMRVICFYQDWLLFKSDQIHHLFLGLVFFCYLLL